MFPNNLLVVKDAVLVANMGIPNMTVTYCGAPEWSEHPV